MRGKPSAMHSSYSDQLSVCRLHEDSYSAWWNPAQRVRGGVWCCIRGEAERICKERNHDGTVPKHDRVWKR